MFPCIMEYDRQHEGTCMLLQPQPFIGEHNARPTVDTDRVVIAINKLYSLFAPADRHSLVSINLVKVSRSGHKEFPPEHQIPKAL